MQSGLRRFAVFALVAVPSVLASGCRRRGTFSFDHAQLEEHIKSSMREEGIDMQSMWCPAGLVLKVGDTFDCVGADADGAHHAFVCTQGEDRLSWKPDGFVHNQLKIGHSIEKDFGKPAHVDCPDKNVLLKKGQWFTCKVDYDGRVRPLYFLTDDDEGNLLWMFSRRHDE
jgi:hypothetical protein